MKRTLGCAAALLLCAVTAHAQGPSFGVRAGVNLATVTFSDEANLADRKNLTGFVAGLFVTVPATDVVAFQPEVLFSRQGTKLTDGSQTARIKIDYVQLPLLGRFALGKGSPVAVLVGPTLGFRNRAKFEIPGLPPGSSDDFEDEINGFDVGLVAGVGVNVGPLVLDGRYTWGLTNILKDSEAGTAKNRFFSATAGFRF